MTPEKQIQNDVLNYLKYLKRSFEPIFYERRQAGGFSYKKGIPDIYCVYYGIHIEIEVKKPGGQLSTMQEKFRDMCKTNDIKWICVDDINVLKDYMSQIKTGITQLS